MIRYRRLPKSDRRAVLIRRGLEYAQSVGWASMTRDGFARYAGCSTGLLNHSFPNFPEFREHVMAEAVRCRDLVVIAHGLTLGSPAALSAPADLQREAALALVGATC